MIWIDRDHLSLLLDIHLQLRTIKINSPGGNVFQSLNYKLSHYIVMFPEFDLFTHTFISQLFRKLLPLTECFLTPQQPPADESIDMIRRTAQQKHAGDQSQIDNIDMKINVNVSLSPCKWLSISITPEFPLTECMSNWPIVQKGIVGNFYES